MVEASDFKDDDQRAMLIDTGFLRPVMKGWYICRSPSDNDGDTTAWYASFWTFVSGYLGKRFGKRYCLNPEASLMLHTGNTTVPRQVTCVTIDSGTSKVDLPFDTSMLVYPDKHRVPTARVEVRGLQVWPVAEALGLAGPSFFVKATLIKVPIACKTAAAKLFDRARRELGAQIGLKRSSRALARTLRGPCGAPLRALRPLRTH